MPHPCDSVLNSGVYNETVLNTESKFQMAITELLSLSEKQIRKEEAISEDDFSFEGAYKVVKGLFSSSSYDQQAIEHVLELKQRYEYTQDVDDYDMLFFKQRVVSQGVLDAWTECMRINSPSANSTGMRASTVGDTATTFSFVVRWIPSMANVSAATILSATYTNLTPLGYLHLRKDGKVAPYSGIQQKFLRDDPDKTASIFITLDGHLPIELTLEAESTISKGIPVGTIIPSMLTFEEFSKYYNPPKAGDDLSQLIWIPADGRPVSRSKYSEIAKQNSAPDLRGRFIRGLNAFSDSEPKPVDVSAADPDTKRIRGSYQEDSVATHIHLLADIGGGRGHAQKGLPGGEYPPTVCPLDGGKRHRKTAGNTDEEGDDISETRPRNIAVYYYLKIN